MKKAISFILLTSVAILFVFSLCGCNNEDKIIGKWKFSSFDFSYGDNSFGTNFDFDSQIITFSSDGTISNSYQTGVWKFDNSSKEYILCDSWEDKDLEYAEKAYIDKDGILHIDAYTYKKV